MEGSVIIVQFANDVNVRFDGWTATIIVSSIYSNELTGLCGKFNGSCANDMFTADGQDVNSAWYASALIGNSYVDYNDPETNDTR
jgi:hypothetical protein